MALARLHASACGRHFAADRVATAGGGCFRVAGAGLGPVFFMFFQCFFNDFPLVLGEFDENRPRLRGRWARGPVLSHGVASRSPDSGGTLLKVEAET